MQATRICAGEYDYRGYSISKQSTGWVISQDLVPTDVLGTLKDAKALIDHYHATEA